MFADLLFRCRSETSAAWQASKQSAISLVLANKNGSRNYNTSQAFSSISRTEDNSELARSNSTGFCEGNNQLRTWTCNGHILLRSPYVIPTLAPSLRRGVATGHNDGRSCGPSFCRCMLYLHAVSLCLGFGSCPQFSVPPLSPVPA